MDPRSEANLAHVHPDLARVIRATAQTPRPFVVTYGVRTLAAEEEAIATGHAWLKDPHDSRHVPQPGSGNFACAVDLTPIIDGKLSFAEGREAEVYGQLSAQVLHAAVACKVPVEWGGGWKKHDWGHFQLNKGEYPQ